MATPIQPSLAQMLQPATPQTSRAAVAPAQTQAQVATSSAQPSTFANALAAQKAFFQQVTAPKITPATYTAADVAKGVQGAQSVQARPTSVAVQPVVNDASQPLKRPGSFLNIVI